jgi:hypothetical protein
MRTYLAVGDIQQAVKKAEEQGAMVAYPPTRQGKRGTFALVRADIQSSLSASRRNSSGTERSPRDADP